MNPLRIATAAIAVASSQSVAAAPASTCYVRTESVQPAEPSASSAKASFLGIRRKTDKLFDIDISVTGQEDTTCSISGVAKIQGEPGSEVLGLVVRPDPSRKSGRTGTLCQVFVRLSPAAVELATTPTSCQAQALCEGKVELNGQRFETTTKLPSNSKGPCFSRSAP